MIYSTVKLLYHHFQSGLYEKWCESEIGDLRTVKAEEAKRNNVTLPPTEMYKGMTLPQLQGPFWILIVGCFIAGITFGFELMSSWVISK